MKYWEIKNSAYGVGEIYLYGLISDSKWWDEDVTPKDIDNELKALGKLDTLNIYVNSGGGSVFAGMAIYNIIKRNDATLKNAYVDGLAASISSVIPLAADKIYMPSNAMMMIHNPSGGVFGESSDMRKMADTLDKVKESIVNVYMEKTGMDSKKIGKLMDNETWMTAKDAQEMGFIDVIDEEKELVASIGNGFLNINGQKFDVSKYKNLPDIYNEVDEEKEKFLNNKLKNTEELANEIIKNQQQKFMQIRRKLLEV